MAYLEKTMPHLNRAAESRCATKAWMGFIVCFLMLVIVSAPALARTTFTNQTPAQGAIINELQPIISVHIEATGDPEYIISGDETMVITGCPGSGFQPQSGLSVSDTRRNSLHQIKSETISINTSLMGCILPTFSHANPALITVWVHLTVFEDMLFSTGHNDYPEVTWSFQIIAPSGPGQMEITGTDPSSGPPGTVVTVHCHFCQQGSSRKAGSEITFDGATVNTTFLSDTQPQFTVPADALCGPHKIEARNTDPITHLTEMSNEVTFTVTVPCSGGSSPSPGNHPPHADFTITPANPTVGQIVHFTDQSTDPDGASDIVSWSWDEGNGTTSESKNRERIYNTATTFTMRLIVTDSAGQTSTASKSVKVTASTTSTSSIKSFDKNNNNKLDDIEFFAAVDAWIAGQITDTTFFKLVDLWISQGPITSASLHSKPFRLDAVTLSINSRMHTVAIMAEGQRVVSMSVEIFNLDGMRLFAQEVTGNHLSWDTMNQNGQPIANGVYLYMVRVRGSSGEALRSEVKKLLVLR